MSLLHAAISDEDNANQTFAVAENTFYLSTATGRLTLLNRRSWQPPEEPESARLPNSSFAYPVPKVATSSTYVLVALLFNSGCTGNAGLFGDLPPMFQYNASSSGSWFEGGDLPGCFLFGRINYTAGLVDCTDCPVVGSGIVELSNTSASTLVMQPDPLVDIAIAMMPEVLTYMAMANATSYPTWNNLDGYVQGMLSVAYQASWNSLTNAFAHGWTNESEWAMTSIWQPESVLLARVSRTRVIAWFVCNVVLTLSGAAILFLQFGSNFEIVRNPELAALLLDSSQIQHRDGKTSSTSIDPTSVDQSLRLRLVPASDDRSGAAPVLISEQVGVVLYEQSFEMNPHSNMERHADNVALLEAVRSAGK